MRDLFGRLALIATLAGAPTAVAQEQGLPVPVKREAGEEDLVTRLNDDAKEAREKAIEVEQTKFEKMTGYSGRMELVSLTDKDGKSLYDAKTGAMPVVAVAPGETVTLDATVRVYHPHDDTSAFPVV